jgi:hypothetical protein
VQESIEKLAKKQVKVTCEVIPNKISYEYMFINDREVLVQFIEVEMNVEYQNNGYQFIAKIEHHGKRNIVCKVVNEDIPLKYYSVDSICEHCNKIRKRNETYLVKNLKDGSYKQVGKSCLESYTSLDIESIVMIMNLYTISNKPREDYCEDSFYNELCGSMSHDSYNLDIDYIKQVMFGEVLSNGYDKENTKKRISDKLCDRVKVDYRKEIESIDRFASELEYKTRNEYLINCINAWFSQSSKHMNLLASFIAYYLKELESIKQNQDTKYVGSVGDRIEVYVASARVLFTNYGFRVAYNTYTNDTYVYKILDKEGNCFVWETSQEVKENQTIRATIKAHKEYKGEKQTIITRGKMICKD